MRHVIPTKALFIKGKEIKKKRNKNLIKRLSENVRTSLIKVVIIYIVLCLCNFQRNPLNTTLISGNQKIRLNHFKCIYICIHVYVQYTMHKECMCRRSRPSAVYNNTATPALGTINLTHSLIINCNTQPPLKRSRVVRR